MANTAFVSTYAPHRCGIATFTRDLASSVGPHQVVALHPVSGPAVYPSVVRHRIRRDSHGDYLVVAAQLNASDVDVVSDPARVRHLGRRGRGVRPRLRPAR